MSKTKTTIYINKEILKQLKIKAVEINNSVSGIIESLIITYLKEDLESDR